MSKEKHNWQVGDKVVICVPRLIGDGGGYYASVPTDGDIVEVWPRKVEVKVGEKVYLVNRKALRLRAAEGVTNE